MSTRLRFPLGSQLAFAISWGRDITGADLSAFLKINPGASDDAAIASTEGDDPQLEIGLVDSFAGDATLTIKAGATSGLTWPFARWQARAELTTGEVIILEQHQGPVELTPIPAGLSVPLEDGVIDTITPDSGSIPVPTPESNMIINRYDLTGLGITTTGATKLSGLGAALLATWADGVIVRLTLAGQVSADYKLVTGAVGTESQWRVACDNSAGRYWQLADNPSKEGAPTVWDATLEKFRQILSGGGTSIALADDADAFVIPD